MRLPLALAALAAFALPALAQQQPRPAPQQPAPRPPAQAQAPAPAPAPQTLFPCRSATEVCHVGVVVNNQVSVLFTNSEKADGIEDKPIDVKDASGAAIDMSRHEGQVVMLTGEYDAATGLTKAELVEAASPLVSFAIKVLLSGEESVEDEPAAPPPPPAPAPRGQAPAAPRR